MAHGALERELVRARVPRVAGVALHPAEVHAPATSLHRPRVLQRQHTWCTSELLVSECGSGMWSAYVAYVASVCVRVRGSPCWAVTLHFLRVKGRVEQSMRMLINPDRWKEYRAIRRSISHNENHAR